MALWHILSGGGFKEVICGEANPENTTRAAFLSLNALSWNMICPACALGVDQGIIDSDRSGISNTLSKLPRKPKMTSVRKILRQGQKDSGAGYYKEGH